MKFFEKNIIVESFFIPKDVTITGTIEGKISGRIEGFIKGDVKINGKVVVSETGSIGGSLKCYDLVLQGVIKGDVVAYNSVHVLPGGIIEGNVSSNSINVDSKANVKGNIKKTVGKEDNNRTSHIPNSNTLLPKHDLMPSAKKETAPRSFSDVKKEEGQDNSNFW
jgi:cytoskeletal protein CcmA (bactofilin family)